MMCAGCSSSVKRMLTQREGVEAAAVNLMTETAAVTIRGAKGAEALRLAEEAAEFVSSKGFPTKVRPRDSSSLIETAQEADRRKQEELAKSMVDVAVAWGLVLVCCVHHMGHIFHSLGWHSLAHGEPTARATVARACRCRPDPHSPFPPTGPVMNLLADPTFNAGMAAFALMGPGRRLLVDGFQSLARGSPNMNSLIGMGAAASFGTGVASRFLPGEQQLLQ